MDLCGCSVTLLPTAGRWFCDAAPVQPDFITQLAALLHLADPLRRRDQARAVIGNEFGELRRVQLGDRAARGPERLDHLGRFHGLGHRLAEPRHDRRRRP